MKTCPECGIELKDEYQYCPEDGATLDVSSQALNVATIPPTPSATAVVLYCPACAAEYPLTFSECPVHHTVLSRHGVTAASDYQPPARRLHLVSKDAAPKVEAKERRTSVSGIDAYEAAIDNLVEHGVHNDAGDHGELPLDSTGQVNEAQKYRKAAMAIAAALALLALLGIYALISNAARKPAKAAKSPVAVNTTAQPTVTVQTPPDALDYQDDTPAIAAPKVASEAAAPPTTNEAPADVRTRTPRSVETVPTPAPVHADNRSTDLRREAVAAGSTRRALNDPPQPAMMRQPAATELVLPRGTFGHVATRLTNVRASRTSGGYRYELTFLLADQVGQVTQWERLAIVTRAASGATRQQQIPFYHRLGADGMMSFTVRVDMPGHAPADWQGRIICTSIGSDSMGREHRASFGANVSPD